MNNIKALIISISDYSYFDEKSNLPYCLKDIKIMKDAFLKGLNIADNNIYCYGDNNIVTLKEYERAIELLMAQINENDTLLIYFSGHGTMRQDEHFLVFSDGMKKTKIIIEDIKNFSCKNKVLFIDACLSGGFKIENSAKIDFSKSLEDFVGKGYAILASCSEKQLSRLEEDGSTFTKFLAYSLKDKFLIKEGKKTLFDIKKLVFFLLDKYNKSVDKKGIQTPIFRASMGGTIVFDIEDYIPYKGNSYYKETERYIICRVDPIHVLGAKRYTVNVILKVPYSIEEIAEINKEIINNIKGLNIFKSYKTEEWHDGKDVNIIWCYYGIDEKDIIDSNFICRTTWIDEKQDANHWYKQRNDSEIVNGVYFEHFTMYTTLKKFIEENTATINDLIEQTRNISKEIINNVETFIFFYNEYLNGTITEQEFMSNIVYVKKKINENYLLQTNLNLPPIGLKEWSEVHSSLDAIAQNLCVYYESVFLERSQTDRKTLVDFAIKDYNKELEKLKEIDNSLHVDNS